MAVAVYVIEERIYVESSYVMGHTLKWQHCKQAAG